MQFSGKEDIEAPIDEVFTLLSEFERYERLAIRRGVEVHRRSGSSEITEGMAWDTVVSVRGKPRRLHVVLKRYEPPAIMRFEASSKGVDGVTVIELIPLSPQRTRLSFHMTLTANTLPARLLLQSLKLAKARLRRQFQLKLAEFARGLEQRRSGWA